MIEVDILGRKGRLMEIICLENLTKKYDEKLVLNKISKTFYEG